MGAAGTLAARGPGRDARPHGDDDDTATADALTPAGRALLDAARPLIALATRLRHSAPPQPHKTLQALAGEVAHFERSAAAAGAAPREVAAASYVLCVWVDEAIADTPWGAGAESLLQRQHGERDGATKVMQLLSRLAEQPGENRALLELFHACLSLGLQGALSRQPDAARQLETLRRRVYMTWPHAPLRLAPPLRSAVPRGPSALRRRLAWGVLPLLGLIALAAYTSSHLLLARQVDRVFAAMQQLAPDAGPAAAPAAGALVPARTAPALAPLLAADVAAGRLAVRDEPNRSVISIPVERLYERGTSRASAAGDELLAHVAAVLGRAAPGGKLLVVGHTDGADLRSARLPSAWHQSNEWAGAVRERLAATLPPERLASEGAGDTDTGSAAPRRRVDIVWYP